MAGALTFLLFLGSLALAAWRPRGSAAGALRMLVWAVFSFLSCAALLGGLFTVWWPPAQTWVIVWSAASVFVLAVILVSKTRISDWLN